MFSYKVSFLKRWIHRELYTRKGSVLRKFWAGNNWRLKDYMGKVKNAACLVLGFLYVCPLMGISRGRTQDWVHLCTYIAVLSVESCGLFSRMFWNIKKFVKIVILQRGGFFVYRAHRAAVLLVVSMLLLVAVEIVSLLTWTSLGFGQNNMDMNIWCSAMWGKKKQFT